MKKDAKAKATLECLPIPDANRCTQDTVGRVFGVSGSAVGKWRGCPRNADRRYSLPAVIEWRIEEAERRCVERAGGDPDLVGPDSPALERLRNAKADLAELDLAQRGRELLPVGEVRESMARAARYIRAGIDRLQKDLGEPGKRAYQIMTDALKDWERELHGMRDG